MPEKRRFSEPPGRGAVSPFAASTRKAGQLYVGDKVQLTGLQCTDFYLPVPLDHFNATDRRSIVVHARQIVATGKSPSELPWICYLQGGPGFECFSPEDESKWLNSAVGRFAVILLDQRGTGQSTPVRSSMLQAVGDVTQQLDYLRCLRADSIVKDAELLRMALCEHHALDSARPWHIIGQSFGGFCATQYLSTEPQGLAGVLLTGGIPPRIHEPCAADAVYTRTFQRVMTQNRKFYHRFPGDVELVKRLVVLLDSQPEGGVRTPNGSMLRSRGLQLLGATALGMGGGFERLHFLLAAALDHSNPQQPELTPTFLKAFDETMPFDTNPLFAVLHEHCYSRGAAPAWAAHRVRESQYALEFDASAAAMDPSRPVFFTGEMIFPWMFDDLAGLRPFKEVAELAAHAEGWSSLYDLDTLRENQVPVAAATYYEDMYVDFQLAQETAACIKGMRQWITTEYQHSGIRDDGGTIFEKLYGMVSGQTLIF